MRGSWLPLLLFAAACGRGDVPASDAEAGPLDEFSDLTLELVHWIGSIDDPEEALTSLGEILLGPGDEVIIGQPLERQMRVFDAAGSPVRRIGSQGEGPGEFQSLSGPSLRGDTLVVFDGGAGRVTFLDMVGEPLHDERWIPATVPAVERGPGNYSWMTYGGNFALAGPGVGFIDPSGFVGASMTPAPVGTELVRSSSGRPILQIDPTGEQIDTVILIVSDRMSLRTAFDGRAVSLSCPWSETPVYDIRPDGKGVIAVERPAASAPGPATYTILLAGMDGDTLAQGSVTYDAMEMPASEVSRTFQEARDERANDRPGYPSAATFEEGLRAGGCVPATYIPVSDVVAAQDGTVWIRREATRDDLIAWDVLDAKLEPMGRVMLPSGQTVAAAKGDILITTELDEYDVPYVIRYRVVR